MAAKVGLASGLVAVALLGGAGLVLVGQLPAIGAGGLLHPARRHVVQPTPDTCTDTTFEGEGLRLRGWRCRAPNDRRGTLVYLHGVADNRTSAMGVIQRFGDAGFDVVAYDSRAHGESEGDACTYGWFEKQDLRRVLDTVEPGPIVLLGTSLGAAVALQEAAQDARVSAVVAVEVFSDLRTVAVERAPFFFTAGVTRRALALAEQQAGFQVEGVSPARAAAQIMVPVLLIHGEADTDTRPEHSRRVFASLRGPKRLIIVPGAGHNGSLRPEVWEETSRWIDRSTRPGTS
jgi:uncharacterized protein